jgi:hypothetical protein
LGGNGSITVDLKTKQLSGSFKLGGQTVLFDAQINIDNSHIGFEKVGIYGETGYGTTQAQGTVGYPAFKQLITEIQKLAKDAGFETGHLEYERRRPDGSPLPDSESRTINLNLK